MELDNHKTLVKRLESELDALRKALKDQEDLNERLTEDLRISIEQKRGLEADLDNLNKAFKVQE
jgi:hypothetical protein